MSVDNFIPELWDARINVALKKSLVYANLGNRDYEGQIRQAGDTVHINEIADFTGDITNYTKDTDITFSQLADASKTLTVDQQKYIAKTVDDIDQAQANVSFLATITNEIGYAFGDNMDSYIAALFAQAGLTDATNIGSSGTPISVTSANVDDYFLSAGELMDKNNVPKQGRFAVIPPWMTVKLNLAAISSLTNNVDEFRNGFAGRAYGFDFYESNNVSSTSYGTNAKILMGVQGRSWTVAQQIVKVEAGRLEKQFGDYFKGLHVYGAKIVRPDMTAVGYATKGAES